MGLLLINSNAIKYSEMKAEELKDFLEAKTEKFNRSEFISTDPIQVPKQFSQKENIEIAAFLTSVISWGNRISIIKNALHLMKLMDNKPYQFITDAPASEYKILQHFVHRTFSGEDCIYFVHSLQNIYSNHNGLESVFEKGYALNDSAKSALSYFHTVFFEVPGERTRKHVAHVENGASGKRLNMFLRWMVRKDDKGVDFGLWKNIPPSGLMLPLDVHTGNVARKLGLLQRKSNDWKAVEEVTSLLRVFDANDPVKYDFALFGLGVFEKF
jgi:uncharacterized protein (TIGR02757 family)